MDNPLYSGWTIRKSSSPTPDGQSGSPVPELQMYSELGYMVQKVNTITVVSWVWTRTWQRMLENSKTIVCRAVHKWPWMTPKTPDEQIPYRVYSTRVLEKYSTRLYRALPRVLQSELERALSSLFCFTWDRPWWRSTVVLTISPLYFFYSWFIIVCSLSFIRLTVLMINHSVGANIGILDIDLICSNMTASTVRLSWQDSPAHFRSWISSMKREVARDQLPCADCIGGPCIDQWIVGLSLCRRLQ
jgi:hypothetical protein